MESPRIVLAGLPPKLEGLRWEFDRSLRLGRQGNLDIVLRDFSVERLHAEIKFSGLKWIVRDLADDERYPTRLNGALLEGSHRELCAKDVLQVGQLMIKVMEVVVPSPDHFGLDRTPGPAPSARDASARGAHAPFSPRLGENEVDADPALLAARTAVVATLPASVVSPSHGDLEIRLTAQNYWEQALDHVARDHVARDHVGRDRVPAQARDPVERATLATLLRTNQHLSKLSSLEELLNSILADAVSTLQAQQGAILLVDPSIDQLVLKATVARRGAVNVKKGYSKTLVERCFRRGESLLCQDVHADEVLTAARSIKQGAMSSVVCALLRSPRRRLGVLHLDRGPFDDPFNDNDLYLADAIAASVAVGIECAQVVEHQREQFVETVTTLARAVEMRDQYTGDHTRRVTDYALLLADELKVGHVERYQIQVGTPLHDIGKIGIDDAILRKPGKLTTAEFDAMKSHTVKGAAILESIGSLNPMIPIVRHHHERWDGSGYPDKLGRDQIAVTARIVAVADAFDAMTSHRPYRPAMPPQLAFLELLSKAGTHFDPACVQAFLRLRGRIEQTWKKE